MSAKLKIGLVLTLSLFATAVVAGVYRIKQWHSNTVSTAEQQKIRAKEISSQNVENPYRAKYKSIPLTHLKSLLRGTDPATLAINAFDPNNSKELSRKVEVAYPKPDRAMVTIIQTNFASSKSKPVKYRVELTSFGRSLFVSSPPLWQIVWAGSYDQCFADRTTKLSNINCR
ncbi:hypothetical protein [Rivularia sp. UHCC 0363]|uniref:hypothetical protein n=1 Tax=Rivularia sp. UHCC 0363 TaxID=3110244 RepID=UPI002B204173|nr:hypothetical protein [Rivularia sp. UHCC 0363]MEA5597044.1 hypothetical protein [Rivularia sp. UHCC 0363]